MFAALDISSSALQAHRTWMDTIAANVAQMNATRNAAGQSIPYRRRFVVMAPGQAGDRSRPGVHVQGIHEDASPFRRVFDPTGQHPDRQPDGHVLYPNVDLAIEMSNAIIASRAYEANITAMEVTKSMINASLRIVA